MPPFRYADEPQHWARCLQIAKGEWRGERQGEKVGGELPTDVSIFWSDFYQSMLDGNRPSLDLLRRRHAEYPPLDLHSASQQFLVFEAQAIYFPMPYLPQVLGIRLATFFGANALQVLYATRFSVLVVCSLLIALAIFLTPPIAKPWIFLFGTLPMVAYQSTSVSADGLTNASALLVTSLVLRRLLEGPLSVLWRGIGFVMCLVLAVSKSCYFPLIAPFCYLQFPDGVSKRTRLGVTALCLAILFGFTLWWTESTRPLVSLGKLTNADAQLAAILRNPFIFVFLYLKTILMMPLWWFETTVGIFGWHDIRLPSVVIAAIATLLGLNAFNLSAAIISIAPPHLAMARTLSWISSFGAAGLVFLGTIMLTVEVGGQSMAPPAGRYFIPALIVSSAFLPIRRKVKWKVDSPVCLWSFAIGGFFATAIQIFRTLY
jgi:uncharacterized membrane protein